MTNEIMKKRATWSVAFDKSNHKAVALLSNIVPHKLNLTESPKFGNVTLHYGNILEYGSLWSEVQYQ